MFLATLAEKLSVVRGEDVNVTMEWLRGGGDTPLRPGSSSKTRFDTGA